MKRTTVPRLLSTLVLSVALGTVPALLFAQHSIGHGFRAGGFHAGSGPGHFYGGHYGGGYYGGHIGYWYGGYDGWHGGYHSGWHGGYWGYPHYGWGYQYYGYGWGFNVGFGWPYSYWPAYPYWYGNDGGTSDLPQYRHYSSCDYRYQCQCSHPDNVDCNSSRYAPQASRTVPRPPITSVGSVKPKPVPSQSAGEHATNQPPLRRDVRRALYALRAMPPAARQRWINSGRYNSFSPEERELLKQISDNRPLATTTR
jgi:hypothetical protein